MPDGLAEAAGPGPRVIAYTDSHAHLSYVAERLGEAEIERVAAAYEGSGELILDPGVELGDFKGRKARFGRYGFVRFAAGVWPDPTALGPLDPALAALEDDIRDEACAAVGECGLDYHWRHGGPEAQMRLFRGQAELAARYGKPLIIHSREAYEDTLRVVKDYAGVVPIVIHCFGYGADEAEAFLKAGCYISFAGNLTYAKAEPLRRALALAPSERLLLETDAPYMNPLPRRGKDSSPLDIGRSYEAAALLRIAEPGALARAALDNLKRILAEH
jgi:TatD DNase family protein